MRLVILHPGTTRHEVLDLMSLTPAIAATIRETRGPGAEELRLVRAVIDPHRVLRA